MNAQTEEWIARRLVQFDHELGDLRARFEGLGMQSAWVLQQMEQLRQEVEWLLDQIQQVGQQKAAVRDDEGSYA